MAAYDSTEDTLKHIRLVQSFMAAFANALMTRAIIHDLSKLEAPEKELFDRIRPLLDKYEYGSAEYKAIVSEMTEGLKHHYAENPHHPEHYENGIDGMSLLDVVEMWCDWKAASMRNGTVSFEEAVRISAERFGMSEQLKRIFLNRSNGESESGKGNDGKTEKQGVGGTDARIFANRNGESGKRRAE